MTFRAIYVWAKHIPFLGSFVSAARSAYRTPFLERRRLRFRDKRAARNILSKLYGEKSEAHIFLEAFFSSKLFKSSFSVGHSGDFDVMMLYALVRMQKPEIVIETGVASGRSSAVILSALHENGKGTLYSIDLPHFYDGSEPGQYVTHEGNKELKGFVPKGKEPGWLVPTELRYRWKLILGDSNVELPKLVDTISSIDIFYHDGDHSYETMQKEFAIAWEKIPKEGFLLSDDIDWNSAWKEFVKQELAAQTVSYRHFGIAKKSL